MSARRTDLHSNLGFDPDALRDKYRRERDKRIRKDGEDQYIEIAGEFARYADEDPYVEPGFTRDATRRRHRRSHHRRRIQRHARRNAAARARRHQRAHHRIGRRLRRHVVLESLPGRSVRHRVVLLPAVARRTRRDSEGEILVCAGDLRALATHRPRIRAIRHHLFPDARHRAALERRRSALACVDESLRRHSRALRHSGGRHGKPSEVAGHSGHRRFQRPLVPYQPLGLWLHRRRSLGWFDEPRRQARRGDRHRCDGDSVRAVRRRARKAALRVPAHAVVGRSARQQADRSRMGEDAAARLATRAPREFRRHRGGATVRRGPRLGRLDRHLQTTAVRRDGARRGGGCRSRRSGGTRGNCGLPEDERNPRARGQDCSRQSRGRSAEALVSPVLQAADVQRRVPRYVQPAERRVGGRQRTSGRRAHYAEGRGRKRHRVRSGLHHLRHRLRNQHRAATTRQLRRRRTQRRVAVRSLEGRFENAARDFEPRLSELVLHRHQPERTVGEHDRDVRRPGASTSPTSFAKCSSAANAQ